MTFDRKVTFSMVDIYFFGRCLGNDKVPEIGNNPLGMENTHFFTKTVDIYDNKLYSKDELNNESQLLERYNISKSFSAQNRKSDDSVQSVYSIDYTSNSLQPLNPKQRIKCLKNAGVDMAKDEEWAKQGKNLVKLRHARQQVGCKCVFGSHCNSSKCSCNKEGIPCLSDGNKFPCKCGSKCENHIGKRAYSNLRIKHHYKHTFDRDLLDYSNNYFNLEEISLYGDCNLCRQVDDDILHQLYGVPSDSHKTRASKRECKYEAKLDISEKRNMITTNIDQNDVCPLVCSTVMPVDTVPVTYCSKNPLTDVDCLSLDPRDNDFGKENVFSLELFNKKSRKSQLFFGSPEKARSAMSQSALSESNLSSYDETIGAIMELRLEDQIDISESSVNMTFPDMYQVVKDDLLIPRTTCDSIIVDSVSPTITETSLINITSVESRESDSPESQIDPLSKNAYYIPNIVYPGKKCNDWVSPSKLFSKPIEKQKRHINRFETVAKMPKKVKQTFTSDPMEIEYYKASRLAFDKLMFETSEMDWLTFDRMYSLHVSMFPLMYHPVSRSSFRSTSVCDPIAAERCGILDPMAMEVSGILDPMETTSGEISSSVCDPMVTNIGKIFASVFDPMAMDKSEILDPIAIDESVILDPMVITSGAMSATVYDSKAMEGRALIDLMTMKCGEMSAPVCDPMTTERGGILDAVMTKREEMSTLKLNSSDERMLWGQSIGSPRKVCDAERLLPTPVLWDYPQQLSGTSKPKKPYRFRQSTTLERPKYFESPFSNVGRRRRSGKYPSNAKKGARRTLQGTEGGQDIARVSIVEE